MNITCVECRSMCLINVIRLGTKGAKMNIDIKDLAEKTKSKRDKNFLETFYNKNFYLQTKNLFLIDSAYKFKDELNLSIKRIDYSNDYIIKVKGE